MEYANEKVEKLIDVEMVDTTINNKDEDLGIVFDSEEDLDFILKAFDELDQIEAPENPKKPKNRAVEYISEKAIIFSYYLPVDKILNECESCGCNKKEKKEGEPTTVRIFQVYDRTDKESSYTYLGNPDLEPTHIMNLIARIEKNGYK